MARLLARHSIFSFPIHKPSPFRLLPIRNESTHTHPDDAVQRTEDAIHRIIVDRYAPDWLPFQPGSSYWVPPRRQSYRIPVLVQKLAASLTNQDVMSLASATTPSSSFYADDGPSTKFPDKQRLREEEE